MFVPWHWSRRAEPAHEGGEQGPSRCLLALLGAGVLSLGFLASESFCIGQEISRGVFGREGRCCNTPASWSLGEAAGGGQFLALPQPLWDNLGRGFVLCSPPTPVLGNLVLRACLARGAERRGSAQTTAFQHPDLASEERGFYPGVSLPLLLLPPRACAEGEAESRHSAEGLPAPARAALQQLSPEAGDRSLLWGWSCLVPP